MDYEYTPLYYSGIVQVRYYDAIDDTVKGGLCYQDWLVDGQTGIEVPIGLVVKMAREKGMEPDNVIVELSWRDINQCLLE